MTAPTFKLSVLREIGWALWDPIGLAGFAGIDLADCADEYDGYLLKAASMSFEGKDTEEVAGYLWDVVESHIGLTGEDRSASIETARAIEKYVSTLC